MRLLAGKCKYLVKGISQAALSDANMHLFVDRLTTRPRVFPWSPFKSWLLKGATGCSVACVIYQIYTYLRGAEQARLSQWPCRIGPARGNVSSDLQSLDSTAVT